MAWRLRSDHSTGDCIAMAIVMMFTIDEPAMNNECTQLDSATWANENNSEEGGRSLICVLQTS